MGGYLLLNIEFETKEDRDKFEKFYLAKRMFQYVDDVYDCFLLSCLDGVCTTTRYN